MKQELVVDIIVQYIGFSFDDEKEDMVGGYWEAKVITGLEDFFLEKFDCRQKDFLLEGRCYGLETSTHLRKTAINNLIAILHEYDLHGKLHIMTEKDIQDYIDKLEAQGRIVLRSGYNLIPFTQ